MALSQILARILREFSEPAERTSGDCPLPNVHRKQPERPILAGILALAFGYFKIH
jgi:hypothetical protein